MILNIYSIKSNQKKKDPRCSLTNPSKSRIGKLTKNVRLYSLHQDAGRDFKHDIGNKKDTQGRVQLPLA